MGNLRVGEVIHITSDDVRTWDQTAAADPGWGAGLLGGKAHLMAFDNLDAVMDKLAAAWSI